MKQWIRWPGLAGFVVVVGLITAFCLLLAGPLVKMAIERFGSKANGAKVELDSVSLNLNPLGFTLYGLQVTDARKPMTNALEISEATAELETIPLLLGKTIIRELSVDGMRFGTERKTSGEIKKEVKASGEKSTLEKASDEVMSHVDIPSAEEILAQETLNTDIAGKAFRDAYASQKALIDSAVAAVPDQAVLDSYQQELKALTSGSFESIEDFTERKKKLDELKARFRKDKAAVEAAKKAIADARAEITLRLTELKNAPGADIDSIKAKYKLDASGAANLTELLLGAEAGQWARQALYWYQKVKPYLAKSEEEKAEEKQERIREGRYVHFPTSNPWPEFLLRNAHVTAVTSGGNLKIEADDITHQPAVLGRPARLLVNGSDLKSVEDLTLDLVLDHRKSPGTDTLTLDVKDWDLKGMNLGVAGTQLKHSMVQVQGLAVIQDGILNARSDAQFTQATFESDSKTLFARELGNALNKINRFDVRAKANGEFYAPSLEFGSDLDRQLSAAFSARLKEKQSELEERLRAKLTEKLEQNLGEYAEEITDIVNMEGSMDDKLSQLTSLAEARLEDFKEQKEREAKEKLAAEKAEAKSKAKDKAKDQLKKLF